MDKKEVIELLPKGPSTDNLSFRTPKEVKDYISNLATEEERKMGGTATIFLKERIALHRAGFKLNDRSDLGLLVGVIRLGQADVDKVKEIIRRARSKTPGGTVQKKSVRK